MKNSYVGDIGDFAKYGLLRHLCGMTGNQTGAKPLRLGVVWYLNEGTGTEYLTDESKGAELAECDVDLYQKLQLLESGDDRRTIAAVRDRYILPCNTLYYERPLTGASRSEWFTGALNAISEAELVFVDPDNGIAPPGRKVGPKHVSIAELEKLWRANKSLVIYQHGNHTAQQFESDSLILKELKKELHLTELPWVIQWHRQVSRAFIVVPHKKHKPALEPRVKALKGEKSPWGKKRPGKARHFTVHNFS